MPDVKVELAVAEFQLTEARRRLAHAQDDVYGYEQRIARLKSQQSLTTSENVADSRTLLNG